MEILKICCLGAVVALGFAGMLYAIYSEDPGRF